jgi:hypothetical protein
VFLAEFTALGASHQHAEMGTNLFWEIKFVAILIWSVRQQIRHSSGIMDARSGRADVAVASDSADRKSESKPTKLGGESPHALVTTIGRRFEDIVSLSRSKSRSEMP